MTGASILWECLEREGVKHVFGYPGGAILPAYDALKHSKIHHVLVRHEQGATHMADGYARASGQVGVAVATSGPGATNMVTGIATAMLDSSPIVCITGQVGSKLIGSDAFQETDITGVTLPITKHNYLVTHASEVARTIREAFYVARSGRPGPVLVDITKDAQQSTCEFDWDAAKPQLPGYRPDLSPAPEEYKQALELIHNSKRPGDSRRARHYRFRGHARGARFCRAGGDSGRDDAAGPGRVPGVAPAQFGHDGHARRILGEPRDPGSGSAAGLWHALRRPRHRQSENLRVQCEEDPHRDRSGGDQQERQGRRSAGRRFAGSFAGVAAARRIHRSQRLAGFDRQTEGRFRRARHSESARQRPSLCGTCHQRSVAPDARRQHDRRHRRRPAPDVGGAVLQA